VSELEHWEQVKGQHKQLIDFLYWLRNQGIRLDFSDMRPHDQDEEKPEELADHYLQVNRRGLQKALRDQQAAEEKRKAELDSQLTDMRLKAGKSLYGIMQDNAVTQFCGDSVAHGAARAMEIIQQQRDRETKPAYGFSRDSLNNRAIRAIMEEEDQKAWASMGIDPKLAVDLPRDMLDRRVGGLYWQQCHGRLVLAECVLLGLCPRCGHGHGSGHQMESGYSENGGYSCKQCLWWIAKEEVRAIHQEYLPYLKPYLENFEQWRQERKQSAASDTDRKTATGPDDSGRSELPKMAAADDRQPADPSSVPPIVL